MTLATPTSAKPRSRSTRSRYRTVADWIHDLGDIPLDRILFDPLPGTATEADLLRKVEIEKRLCELVDGTLVEKPMGYMESLIAAALIEYLRAYVRRHKLGLVTGEAGLMRIAKGLVRVPDVSFVSYARLPGRKVPAEPIPSLAPDLAAEILSASNTRREMARKVRDYFQSGSREVWLIDPRARTARVFTSPTHVREIGPRGTLSAGDAVPGFSIPLRKLFEELDGD